MIERPVITADSTDADIVELAEEMWPVIVDLPADEGKAVFVAVAKAYRGIMRGDVTPARAVTMVSTIALFVSGQSFEQVPGPRIRVLP